MNMKNKVLVSGVLAAVIAVALIGAAVFTPGLVNGSSSSGTTISTSSSSASPSSQSTNTPNQSGSGTLAVLMTDPPTVPDGVTAVYINYSSMEVHFSQAGNQTGWTDLQTSGEIDLMSIVNESQTIASANISSGNFNGLRFNVTSAVVTFQGTNYTADLVYQDHTLYVWIPGGIIVSDGQTTGELALTACADQCNLNVIVCRNRLGLLFLHCSQRVDPGSDQRHSRGRSRHPQKIPAIQSLHKSLRTR